MKPGTSPRTDELMMFIGKHLGAECSRKPTRKTEAVNALTMVLVAMLIQEGMSKDDALKYISDMWREMEGS